MSATSPVTFAAQDASPACLGFAEEVGGVDAGSVRVVGGGTQRAGAPDPACRSEKNTVRSVDEVGPVFDVERADVLVAGDVAAGIGAVVREVRAPSGIVSIEPEELIVRCGAGTPWAALDGALAERGLLCALDPVDARATVGGILAVGRNGIRRNRNGQVRDLLLEARYISAQGICIKAGAPVVKNVTGYDLCRLLVGSWGTLGFLSEVVLRCRPRPAEQVWLRAQSVDPFAAHASLVAPGAVLWDGTDTYVLLEGTSVEVRVGRSALGPVWETCEAPALTAFPHRVSLRNSVLRSWHGGAGPLLTGAVSQGNELGPAVLGAGTFLAEVGVGIVHCSVSADAAQFPNAPLSPAVVQLQRDLKAAFDPTGRLNPGVQPW
jgi:FAD/FMN-containing dehydrogenase